MKSGAKGIESRFVVDVCGAEMSRNEFPTAKAVPLHAARRHRLRLLRSTHDVRSHWRQGVDLPRVKVDRH